MHLKVARTFFEFSCSGSTPRKSHPPRARAHRAAGARRVSSRAGDLAQAVPANCQGQVVHYLQVLITAAESTIEYSLVPGARDGRRAAVVTRILLADQGLGAGLS